MLFVYPALFHQEKESYWVEFPDLPGCQTFGDTLNETMGLAQEALTGYLLTLLEQNQPIAPPSDISTLTAADGFPSLVACDINQYKATKAVKKTLTIPAWLNDRATALNLNFSQVLQDALLSKIQTK